MREPREPRSSTTTITTLVSHQEEKYSRRINDWIDFTQLHYGLDQLHARLLASTFLPTAPGVEPTWLCVESPFHPFWDHFAEIIRGMGLPEMLSHYDLYTLRPRTMRDTYAEILGTRESPRVMIDTDWSSPVPYPVHVRSRFPVVRGQFVRVRVPVPVVTPPQLGVKEEMGRLFRLVVDREFREVGPKPIRAGRMLENVCTLLTLLNPEVRGNVTAFINNLTMIPSAMAVLHGREEVRDEDQMVLLHVLRGTVRVWTLRILELFGEGDGSAWTVGQIAEKLGMRRKVVWDECDRLAWDGVMDWPLPRGKWKGNRPKYVRLSKEWGMEVRGLVGGLGGLGGGLGNGEGMRWWK